MTISVPLRLWEAFKARCNVLQIHPTTGLALALFEKVKDFPDPAVQAILKDYREDMRNPMRSGRKSEFDPNDFEEPNEK